MRDREIADFRMQIQIGGSDSIIQSSFNLKSEI